MSRLSGSEKTAVFVASAVVAAPVFYILMRFEVVTLREAFLANLAATAVGIVVGIPVALEINRSQIASQEERAKVERERIEAAIEREVLGLLQEELAINKAHLAAVAATESGKRQIMLPGPKFELWTAFSDSGELNAIRDPKVIAAISHAYHYIRRLVHLEDSWLTVANYPGMMIKQDVSPAERYEGYLAKFDPIARSAIDTASSAIRARLESLSI